MGKGKKKSESADEAVEVKAEWVGETAAHAAPLTSKSKCALFRSVRINVKGGKAEEQRAFTCEVGDFVLLRSEEEDGEPYAARIMDLFEERGKKFASVQWMYRPKDVPGMSAAGKDELIYASEHLDRVEVDTMLERFRIAFTVESRTIKSGDEGDSTECKFKCAKYFDLVSKKVTALTEKRFLEIESLVAEQKSKVSGSGTSDDDSAKKRVKKVASKAKAVKQASSDDDEEASEAKASARTKEQPSAKKAKNASKMASKADSDSEEELTIRKKASEDKKEQPSAKRATATAAEAKIASSSGKQLEFDEKEAKVAAASAEKDAAAQGTVKSPKPSEKKQEKIDSAKVSRTKSPSSSSKKPAADPEVIVDTDDEVQIVDEEQQETASEEEDSPVFKKAKLSPSKKSSKTATELSEPSDEDQKKPTQKSADDAKARSKKARRAQSSDEDDLELENEAPASSSKTPAPTNKLRGLTKANNAAVAETVVSKPAIPPPKIPSNCDEQLWDLLQEYRSSVEIHQDQEAALEVLGYLKLELVCGNDKRPTNEQICAPSFILRRMNRPGYASFVAKARKILGLTSSTSSTAYQDPSALRRAFTELENHRPGVIFGLLGRNDMDTSFSSWLFPSRVTSPIFGSMLGIDGFRTVKVTYRKQTMFVPIERQENDTVATATNRGFLRLVDADFSVVLVRTGDCEFDAASTPDEPCDQIFVKTVNGRTISLHVPLEKASLGFVKALIGPYEGLLPHEQRFEVAGKPVAGTTPAAEEDSLRLTTECNVKPFSTMFLVLKQMNIEGAESTKTASPFASSPSIASIGGRSNGN